MPINKRIRVTFRASDEKLTSMFAGEFPSVTAAKAAMKEDAKVWCKAHNGKMKWVNPKEEDYLEAVSKSDNLSCVWQYFNGI